VAEMERLFSSYRQDSVLAQVNRAAGGEPVSVPGDFVTLALLARKATEVSEGAFNPLVGPAVRLWGIPENPRVPDEAELTALRPLVSDPQGLAIDEFSHRVRLREPGMALGYGGIAKGFTADKVTEVLQGHGIAGGIVAIAGDIRVFGTHPDGTPWRVGVRPPREGEGSGPLATLEMTGGAVSTSGDYERFFELDGVRYHHILDPRTLWPAKAGTVSVTVTAHSGALADALATALFVMGPVEGLALAERMPRVEALFVDTTGTQSATSGWPGTEFLREPPANGLRD